MNNKIGNYIKIIIPGPEPDFAFSLSEFTKVQWLKL